MNYTGHPGHGTRVGSVIYGDLPGTMQGVAPRCPVVPYRVTNTVALSRFVNRYVSNVRKAIRRAVDQTDCNVISISLGGPWTTSKKWVKPSIMHMKMELSL